MKQLALLMILVGAVLGPGYWVYMTFFSGRAVLSLPLHPLPGGMLASPEFELPSAALPMSLVVSVQASFTPNLAQERPPRDRYRARLLAGERPLQAADLELAAPSVELSQPVFRQRLFTLDGKPQDRLQLRLEPVGDPVMTLGPVQLQLRAAAGDADPRLVGVGAALLAAGLLGLLWAAW
jgi:hypothetical protein